MQCSVMHLLVRPPHVQIAKKFVELYVYEHIHTDAFILLHEFTAGRLLLFAECEFELHVLGVVLGLESWIV
jgi:hypothetical protein